MDGSLAFGAATATPAPVFDPSEVRSSGWRPRLQGWAIDQAPLVFRLLRTALPNGRVSKALPAGPLRGVVWASRRDDVEAVLDNGDVFHSRSGARIGELQEASGIRFPPPVLGLRSDHQASYDAVMRRIARVIRLDDAVRAGTIVKGFVAPQVAGAGTIDAGPLFLRAAAHLAREYFGLLVGDGELHEMALCCLSLVAYAFGNDELRSPVGRLGVAAASRISTIVRRSLRYRDGSAPNTVIGRLVADGATEAEIESMLTVLMMALVAVPGTASINVLRLLLRRPEAMRLAPPAARGAAAGAVGGGGGAGAWCGRRGWSCAA